MNQLLHGEVTTLATCWLIERKDGNLIGFTDSQEDIVLEGVTYHASPGIERSALQCGDTFKADHLEMEVLFNSDLLKEEDIQRGAFDFATVYVFVVDYTQPEKGRLSLLKGSLGPVTQSEGVFKVELYSLANKLDTKLGSYFSPGCRAQLGDTRCGIKLRDWQVESEIVKVIRQDLFQIAITASKAPFKGGRVTWLTGQNKGIEQNILDYDDQTQQLTLFHPVYAPLKKGDRITLTPGCDKSIKMCSSLYKNALNFRGEPFVSKPREIARV